jgi:menaquinol-cytochrome c reductase iron-sulfur subunit
MTDNNESRRGFLGRITGGILGLGLVTQVGLYIRSLSPNVLYEPARRFKVGSPDDFPAGVKFLAEKRLYIFREGNSFHAISAVCTHLGCTVKYAPFRQPKRIDIRGEQATTNGEFKCPCHGSFFYEDGTNYDGPAPKPLAWFHIEVSPEDGQLMVDLNAEVDRDFRLVV